MSPSDSLIGGNRHLRGRKDLGLCGCEAGELAGSKSLSNLKLHMLSNCFKLQLQCLSCFCAYFFYYKFYHVFVFSLTLAQLCFDGMTGVGACRMNHRGSTF